MFFQKSELIKKRQTPRQLFYSHSFLPSKNGHLLKTIQESQHFAPAGFVTDTRDPTAN